MNDDNQLLQELSSMISFDILCAAYNNSKDALSLHNLKEPLICVLLIYMWIDWLIRICNLASVLGAPVPCT